MGDYNTTKAVAIRALERGGRKVSATKVEWRACGNCQAPVTVERHARASWQCQPDDAGSFLRSVQQFFPGATLSATTENRGKSPTVVHTRDGRIPIWLIAEVPCRKCDNCLERRRRMWSIRAMREYRVARRTWFGTLTIGPRTMQAARDRARRRVGSNEALSSTTGEFLKDDFDAMSKLEQAREIHREISPEITRYLKRVRKGALPYARWPWRNVACAMYGAKLICKFRYWDAWETHFRFLCVAELGKENGRLHYHVLLHEHDETASVRRALLGGQWAQGFSDWKLCSSVSQATYVCKYLTKSLLVRVRASKDYGEGGTTSVTAKGVEGTINNLTQHSPELLRGVTDEQEKKSEAVVIDCFGSSRDEELWPTGTTSD